MEIYPFDKTMTDVFTDTDVSGIQADGITIRNGNKIIRLQVTEETVVDDTESVKQELETKFAEKYNFLEQQFNDYKEQMKHSLRSEKQKLERKQNELDRRMNEHQVMPNLSRELLHQGLAVATNERGGLVWSYKTVYAPKMVGNRRIDPTFAKRLVTPISIEAWTNAENKVHKLIVRQILGNKKFHHYHSMSQSSDCWGNFAYDGKRISDPAEMLAFLQEVSGLLEVINDMSIGTNNPRGLSRLATLEKHLLKAEEDAEDKSARSTTNSRNTRAGVDMEERAQQNAESVWST